MSKILYLVLLIYSIIPIRILYLISTITQWINKYIISYRIAVIQNNIELAFPNITEKEKNNLIDLFYKHFFNTIVEIIKSITLRKKQITEKVRIKNINVIQTGLKEKKHIILLCAHYANWEWLLLRLSLIKNINLNAVYKPLSNKYFNKILFTIRSKFGAELVPLKKWKYFMLRKKNTPNTFMFVSDQVPNPKESSTRINFFNHSTLFHKGAEKTAKLLNADVFYVAMNRSEKKNYIIEFKKIDPNNITKQYVCFLESTIKKKPEYWLWSHNRWKR